MLMGSMQNVVVCSDYRQGPSEFACLLAHCIRNGMIVVTIILVEDRSVQIYFFL
jgi:hypothetical protein